MNSRNVHVLSSANYCAYGFVHKGRIFISSAPMAKERHPVTWNFIWDIQFENIEWVIHLGEKISW